MGRKDFRFVKDTGSPTRRIVLMKAAGLQEVYVFRSRICQGHLPVTRTRAEGWERPKPDSMDGFCGGRKKTIMLFAFSPSWNKTRPSSWERVPPFRWESLCYPLEGWTGILLFRLSFPASPFHGVLRTGKGGRGLNSPPRCQGPHRRIALNDEGD